MFSFGELSRRVRRHDRDQGGEPAADRLLQAARGAREAARARSVETARGVVAGSAGNHAQALAYAARARGIPCTVFMPKEAPRLEGGRGRGLRRRACATRAARSTSASSAARELAEREGLTFVHPFDDLEVIEGQAGVGLELREQVPDLAQVIVPVGGGGLIGGVAAALRRAARRRGSSASRRPAARPFRGVAARRPPGRRRRGRRRSPTASRSSGPAR